MTVSGSRTPALHPIKLDSLATGLDLIRSGAPALITN
jgi:hypothetical protein